MFPVLALTWFLARRDKEKAVAVEDRLDEEAYAAASEDNISEK
jgi:hypothetical protein